MTENELSNYKELVSDQNQDVQKIDFEKWESFFKKFYNHHRVITYDT